LVLATLASEKITTGSIIRLEIGLDNISPFRFLLFH